VSWLRTGVWFWLMVIGHATAVFSEQERKLSQEDRIDELEARVSALSAEVEAAKAMATQERPSAFNPSITVVGDIVGQYGFNMKDKAHEHGHHHDHDDHHDSHDSGFVNGVKINEIEFEFGGAVDPYADALVAIAFAPKSFHDVHIHVEEAYARLKEWPVIGFAPLGMIFKAGIFKSAIGRVNRLHRHNLPQMDYPLATKSFLGGEGYSAKGLSLSAVFNPWEKTAITVFLEGAFNSPLPMQAEGAERVPNGLAHLWLHQELTPEHFLDVGVSGLLGRKGEENSGTFGLLGGDVHYSYLPTGYGQDPMFLFGSEVYSANRHKKENAWSTGFFTWAQVKLFGSSFFGLRYDLAPKFGVVKDEHALGAYLSYYTTEFLRFRLGYEHVMPKLEAFDGDHRLMLSIMFLLGSHPAEPYFANR